MNRDQQSTRQEVYEKNALNGLKNERSQERLRKSALKEMPKKAAVYTSVVNSPHHSRNEGTFESSVESSHIYIEVPTRNFPFSPPQAAVKDEVTTRSRIDLHKLSQEFDLPKKKVKKQQPPPPDTSRMSHLNSILSTRKVELKQEPQRQALNQNSRLRKVASPDLKPVGVSMAEA
mmetsp:Transcript_16645/g.25663  ORF Transcript_16645/g.25663 Transcript_16645/m.25663 type:complete len:175 (-) Transcript_16645:1748-2272(-)